MPKLVRLLVDGLDGILVYAIKPFPFERAENFRWLAPGMVKLCLVA